MKKYLYGASVQGIQDFIFQTNKLKEISGASELVEQICTNMFRKVANVEEGDDNVMLAAAGNIKYVFTNKTACERFVRIFPKVVMETASGITISQAVVAFEGEVSNENTQELEKKLRIQRNRTIQIPSANLMVSEVARKTGGASVESDNKEFIDLGQFQKRNIKNKNLLHKIVGNDNKSIERFPTEINDIASDDSGNWIAVVHADGNNLGQKIIAMVDSLEANVTQQAIREFSILLDKSTVQAAEIAFKQVIETVKDTSKFPFRPVVLGGDDLTAIIRGDLAIEFTKIFLEQFEIQTNNNFKSFIASYGLENLFGNGLTACAGISYIKASYPFHYGVKLSETLCKKAKTISKEIDKEHTPSSLVFHKVHASFVEDYDDIIKKELSAKESVQFNYGPYFLEKQKGYLTIDELQNKVKVINKKDAPKSGLRTWLTEIKENEDKANQLMQRIKSLNDKFDKDFNFSDPFSIRSDNKKYTPIFDIISLSNIQKDK